MTLKVETYTDMPPPPKSAKIPSKPDSHYKPKAPDNAENMIEQLRTMSDANQILSIAPFLPAIFKWENKPVTLEDYFYFESLFNVLRPLKVILKLARQLGKTMQMCMTGVARPAFISDYKTLFVTPLFEQCRRMSSNYCRPLIDNSPFRPLWSGPGINRNVLQRSFRSGGRIQFTFAFNSVDRARGIFADELCIDEIQDFNHKFIPILAECLNVSKWKIIQLGGTPKTTDNSVEVNWRESSQAEWFIPCPCGKWNIPSIEFDLLKMVGKFTPDISKERPGCVCAECGRPLNPNGFEGKPARWVHRFEEKKMEFSGFHVPQVIAPIHCCRAKDWEILVKKSKGEMGYSEQQYHNEVLAESSGLGMQLISEEELQAASILPWKNNPKSMDVVNRIRLADYQYRALGVDWGGGGEEGVSLTAHAVAGLKRDGSIDILWGRKLLTPLDHNREAGETLHTYNAFRCNLLAHDFNGSGDLRETMIKNTEPTIAKRLFRADYKFGGPRVRLRKPTDEEPRKIYRMNRTRCILTVLQAIRKGKLRFFQYDYVNKDERGLLTDFVYLLENKSVTKRGADIYTIGCHASFSDDFVHAVVYACCALWHSTGSWPIKDGVPDITPREPSHRLIEEVDPDDPNWEKDDRDD